MEKISYKHILDKIKDYKSICIIGHIDPDPDALASMVAMKEFIKSAFKNTCVKLYASFNNLSEENKLILSDEQINSEEKGFDLAISLDCPNLPRLGEYSKFFESAKHTIVIDHHDTNTYFGDDNIINICSSTCEIVYGFFKEYNVDISDKIYERIYTGLITDTMNFTVGAFNKNAFVIASECFPHCNVKKIYEYFLGLFSHKNLKMTGVAFDNTEMYFDNRVAISHISFEEEKNHGSNPNDYVGIVNRINRIERLQIACFIYPKGDTYYITLRGKPAIDVGQIAKKFGGGGHAGAAGFLSKKSINEIKTDLLHEFKKIIKEKSNSISPYKF